MWTNLQIALQAGFTYAVTLNGKVYSCVARVSGNGVVLGNNSSMTLNDFPFSIQWAGGSATAGMFFKDNTISSPVTLKVTDVGAEVFNKMPEGYLPDSVVKTVNGKTPDENGNVIVETGSNGAGIHIGIEEPTDENVSVWIDTDAEPESSGGGSSIDVTAEVGQTIVVEEVDANGKPTKWKAADYPLEVNEIIPQTTYTAEYNPTYGGFLYLFEISTQPVVGHKYTVIFDGMKYNLTAKLGTLLGTSVIYIGNGVMLGDDTGEPFCLAIINGMTPNGYINLIGLDGDEHTVCLYTAKFFMESVSNAFPYYIEMDYLWNSQEYEFTCYDTAENVKAIFDSGRLVRIRAKHVDSNSHTIAGNATNYFDIHQYLVTDDGRWAFVFMFGNTAYMIMAQEDGTLAVVEVGD
jgi:hypothetical protein